MEGHEESTERTAADDCNRSPDHGPAQGDADDADSQRGEIGVARKPYRPQVAHLSVALGMRHVVDRMDFDDGSMRQIKYPLFSIY